MTASRREIDQLIDEVTVDCYNEDEARSAFVIAIQERLTRTPVAATIVGFETELIGVDDGGDRRGLVAQIRHSDRVHVAALHDVALVVDADTDADLAALFHAYREWCQR